MDKSKQRSAGSESVATPKWADQVEINENSKRMGIELLFNNEPARELQSKLRATGFRPSKVKNMWYSDNNPNTKAFALEVQSTIAGSVTGPDLILSPSFEATRTNIEKKEFSFILITLKDGQIKNYIVFEPSKPKAEVIATQFFRQEFGDDFLALAAKPRAQIREARMLFDEDKIIFPTGQHTIEEGSTKALPSPVQVELLNTLTIEKEKGLKKTNPFSKTKKQSLHDLNKEIEALIDRRDGNKEFFSEEEKNLIRQYSGSGGLINQGATGKGVLYEYYTADAIIKKMWDIAYHYGYDGGAVLEPSVGTGNFLKYGPKGSAIVGYEINHYAARIAQILYPAAQIHEAPFETLFFAGNIHLKDDFGDTRYSLVIGNPPYGEFSGRYAGMGEKKWTGASQYEHYFTLRGLDLLKSGGLLIYIVPSNFLRGSSFSAIAEKIAAKCIGLDRYCLGTGIFKTTDIETDIIALRKN